MSTAAADTMLERIANAHAALRGRLPGGSRWEHRREQAFTRFMERGLPGRRDENWRYLDWAEIGRRDFSLFGKADREAATPVPMLPDLPQQRTILLVDGSCVPERLPSIPGVEVLGLAEAIEREPELLSRTLSSPGDDADDRFALLAEAFTNDGVIIRVAPGTVLEEPLFLVHASNGKAGSSTRVLLEAGTGSRLQLVEHFVGTGDSPPLSNLACELRIADAAAVDHLRLHQQTAAAAHVETLRVAQGADSRYRQQLFLLGGRVLRSNLQLRLEGTSAECEIHGLFMVDGQRQADLYTLIEHVAGHTISRELVRGVATDRGHGAFNGRIVVGPGAGKADSSQSSRNLLLSPLAEIDARPQLEILTDDVKCSHGATIGSLDANQLFYLLSRGIDPATARGLLTFAFCEDVVSRVALPALRRHIEELVVGRLPDRDIIREFL